MRGFGGVTASNAGAILLGGSSGDYSQLLVRQQDAAPDYQGEPMQGVRFVHLNDPVINAQGYAAFTAMLAGSGVDRGNNTGLWWGSPGNLILVARKGDLAPGTRGRFSSFISLALPDASSPNGSTGPVFVARLVGGENEIGLFALTSQGDLQPIALKGSYVKVNGIYCKVTDVAALAAVPFSPAQPRSYNSEHELIYRLTLQGGRQKIVTALIP
jgi:hypothetical protein